VKDDNKEKWLITQKHEKEYTDTGKNLQWNVPYSLEHWQQFLSLKSIKGQGVEVGCGLDGLYNFTDKVVGLDPINYGRKNFVLGVGEHLPFRKVDFVICCNGIDHFCDLDESMSEMLNISNKVILWLNIFPKWVSWLLNIFDKTHTYHLTAQQIHNLVCRHNLDTKLVEWVNLYKIHGKYAKRFAKIKLFFANLIGIRGLCVHVEVDI